jgi:hypothetical protein
MRAHAAGWTLTTGYERVCSLNGNTANNGSTEATSDIDGVGYTARSDWKRAARLELLNGSTLLDYIERDLTARDDSPPGVYWWLRFKLDEALF